MPDPLPTAGCPGKPTICLENCGNTVSSTIPLMMDELRRSGKLTRGTKSMMLGFGVGLDTLLLSPGQARARDEHHEDTYTEAHVSTTSIQLKRHL